LSEPEKRVCHFFNNLYSVIAKYLFVIKSDDCKLAIRRRFPSIETDGIIATRVRTCELDVAIFQQGLGHCWIAEDRYIQIIFLVEAGISEDP
jgi:hypothetical protein